MNPSENPTRRAFLQLVSTAGCGLVLGFRLGEDQHEGYSPRSGSPPGAAFEPNAWLTISPDGRVTVTVARTELGQGVRTALPMILAEELEADWTRVAIQPALADEKYGDMTTGGSTSVNQAWAPLRKAGATAREMLLSAAASLWGVEKSACRAENGTVVHTPSGRRSSFGELSVKAAALPVPENVPLKSRKNFTIVGKSLPRLDADEKARGSALFGIDVKVPGMLYAAVARCPVYGGRLLRFEAGRAKAIKGVRNVVQVSGGVAVLADSTYAAFQGRDALDLSWEEGQNSSLTSDTIRALFQEKSKRADSSARREGDVRVALGAAARKIQATYSLPFLAHADMEPMNCLASVEKDSAELWAPTQTPQWAQRAVAQALGTSPQKVVVHTTLAGGGFGRRLMTDFAVEASLLSKAAGVPVKVVWSREDDFQGDFFRPASYHVLAAGMDSGGKLVAWWHHLVGPSISAQAFPQEQSQGPPDLADGAENLSYAVPNILVEYTLAPTPVPIGWFRSVYNSQNAFVNESFIDEAAHAAGADPFEFRRSHLDGSPRLRAVLERAAAEAGWGTPLPAGVARGIACHACFGSYAAHVVEISRGPSGVKIQKVTSAVDSGIVVNPNILKSQVEGAVVMGLSAALKGEIRIAKGRPTARNFDDYPLLTIDETPQVDVHIIDSEEDPTGIGEPGLPPIAPALANAVFALTGRRAHELPLQMGV